MARTKSGTPLRWERLLMVLGNGGFVSLKEIEDTMDYHNMYRISCEIYVTKLNGGVVRTHKDGRKVTGYELINAQYMVDQHLTPSGYSVLPIVGRDTAIEVLSDLKAEPVAKPATKKATKKVVEKEVLEVEEITE